MDIKQTITLLCEYCTTKREQKKHGEYLIYEDDCVECSLDTYYPNIQVNVKVDVCKELVYLRSGHGNTQEYHPGAWEKHIHSLEGVALAGQRAAEEAKERRAAARNNEKWKGCSEEADAVFERIGNE